MKRKNTSVSPAPLPAAGRTDLALEAHERLLRDAVGLPGVRSREVRRRGITATRVDVLDETGAKTLGKPVGAYLTLEFTDLAGQSAQARRRVVETLAGSIAELLGLSETASVLVAGLGNAAVTPDAVGPRTLRRLLVTRHLLRSLPASFGSLRPVSAIQPGVLGETGLESAEIVRAVVGTLRPDCLIVVDALAALRPERLCATVQLTDVGIVPGSGVGNHRAAFTKETMGVPVCAIGVPTVCDYVEAAQDRAEAPVGGRLLITPRGIDAEVTRMADLIAGGLNRALHPGLTQDQLARLCN